MAATILVSVALSFLAGLVAHGLEKVFAYGRLPRRIVWLMGLFSSVTLTMLMLFQSGSMLQLDPASGWVAWIRFAPGAALQPFVVRYIPALGWPQIDRLLVEAWVVSCVIYVTYLLWQGLWEGARLRTESRTWRQYQLNNEVIYVSEDFGPAAVGIFRPKIVFPRWLLNAPDVTRTVALAHEREHIECADTLVYIVSLILRSVAPWNLVLGLQLRRLNLAIELDCDSRVCRRLLLGRPTYAEALDFIWRRGRLKSPADSLAGSRSDVARRIRILLSQQGRVRYRT